MDKINSKLYCAWADKGLAMHNSGAALLCCHSREFLKDDQGKTIYWHTHTLNDAWASPTRKQIQDSLHRGEKHTNCAACWAEEAAGTSRRTSNLHVLDDAESIVHDVPRLLDLKLGTVCNLSCRTCNPYVSSKWVRDWWLVFDKNDPNSRFQDYNSYVSDKFRTSNLSYDDENKKFWNQLNDWLPYAHYIDIYGAEPMLIHRLFDVLNHSVAMGYNARQTLHFNTNATIWNQSYIDTLSKFKKVYFDLSIDGLYDHYDYIRNGETWSVVAENLKRYQEFRDQYEGTHPVSICITVSFLNIYYLNEIAEYFHDWYIHFNMAHQPQHVSIKALPREVKEKIKEKFSSSTDPKFASMIRPVLDYMDQDFENDPFSKLYKNGVWAELVRSTNELDRIRNQDFAKTFPEFYQLIEPYFTRPTE